MMNAIPPLDDFEVLRASQDRAPLITIAIPTFNRAHWLSGCIAAALDQTYEHFEIVVSDNASTDDTARLLAQIGDPRLRVVRQESNIGSTPNWNACLAAARGEYVVFVADDDRIKPWLLRRCVELIVKEPQLPIVISLSDVYLAEENRMLPARASRKLATGIWSGIEIFQEFLRGGISCDMCTIAFRTNVLRAQGGLPVDWPNAADLACWMPLLMASSRGGLVNETCGTFCVHDEAQSSKFVVDVRLGELRRLVDLLQKLAQAIGDKRLRFAIELDLKRYFSCHAIALLASHRKKGATLAETLPFIRRWRRELSHVGPGGIRGLVRPTVLLLFPRSLTRTVRKLIQLGRSLARRPEEWGT